MAGDAPLAGRRERQDSPHVTAQQILRPALSRNHPGAIRAEYQAISRDCWTVCWVIRGCFGAVQSGHVNYLVFAAKEGDIGRLSTPVAHGRRCTIPNTNRRCSAMRECARQPAGRLVRRRCGMERLAPRSGFPPSTPRRSVPGGPRGSARRHSGMGAGTGIGSFGRSGPGRPAFTWRSGAADTSAGLPSGGHPSAGPAECGTPCRFIFSKPIRLLATP